MLIAWILPLLLPALASANPTNTRFCAKYQVNYDDALVAVGDDYFTDNTDKPALGARVDVYRSNGALEWSGYTPDSGVDEGCTPYLPLDTEQAYDVKVYAIAMIHSTCFVKVMNDTSNQNVWFSLALDDFFPPAGNSSIITPTAATHAAWNIAAAAGKAVYRNPAGVCAVPTTFQFFTQACNNGSSCFGFANQYIKIAPGDDQNKYTVGHELGHAVTWYRVPNGFGNLDFDALAHDCPLDQGGNSAWQPHTREHQKAATLEGVADFYAVAAFNDSGTDADCMYMNNSALDWDRNGATASEAIVSCETNNPATGISAGDLFGDECAATGATENKATAHDWLRFWWDMHTDSNVANRLGVEQIFGVYAHADPSTWTANTNQTGPGFPPFELEDACFDLASCDLPDWDAEDNYNGVDR